MFLERVLAMDAATRLRGPLFITDEEDSELDTAGAGDSTLEDGDLDGQDDEIEERAGTDADGEKTADESEAETARRRRFKDQDAAEEGFTELQRHKDRVEQDNAELRRQLAERELKQTAQPSAFEANEAALTQISEAVGIEYNKLPKEQQNLAGATRIMLRHVAKMNAAQAAQAAEAKVSEAQLRANSIEGAKRAMAAQGLDPENADQWDLYILNKDIMQRADPQCFRGKTGDEQFKAIAAQTIAFMRKNGMVPEALKKAKDDHNREAGGTMTGSTRRPTTTKVPDDADDDKHDTMQADLNENRRSLRHRAGTQYALLGRTGGGQPARRR